MGIELQRRSQRGVTFSSNPLNAGLAITPRLHNLLPCPAAMIRHFMLLFSIGALDEGFGHAIGLAIRVLPWRVFAEVGRWSLEYTSLTAFKG